MPKDPALYPVAGVPVRTPQDLWAALLALNDPARHPYTVRAGFADGADLVAEYRRVLRAYGTLTGRRRQECEEFQVRMWFDPAIHQVRSVDHMTGYTLTLTDPPRRRTTSWSRGQLYQKHTTYEWGRTPEGRRRFVETSRFDSGVLKQALQSTALAHGWSWLPLTRPPS
ncbi:hypothetical protein [Actinacidiphila reveromycinica]|uniref:hypothetical protein n=1 Tax=Actinacidiphila reveromycinica TaxID=659352 RepID=UPI001921ED4F|nr:hypothetical protein [Streptomyces sp. SN-593]